MRRPRDSGSVSPLVIGMMICLLLLSAAVVAAGSAFLAKRRVQAACDAAASAVLARVPADQLALASSEALTAEITEFLDRRYPQVRAQAEGGPLVVRAFCRSQAAITFGSIFATPTMQIDVHSVAQGRSG